MVKNIIGGIAVGIANVIPGVSGGTMMVILGIFERMMEVISRITKPNNKHLMEDIIFLAQVMIGAGVGVVGFANLLEILFASFPTPTIWWFIGLIAWSIPLFVKKEMAGKKFYWLSFVIGAGLIFGLEFLNPGSTEVETSVIFPTITLIHLVTMLLVGVIGGATMLMPGVSGSLVLLIIGQYYLFKSYLANVTSFEIDVLISLAFIGIGVLIGIVSSAKVCAFFIENHEDGFLSFILGLICASSLILIPYSAQYGVTTVIASGAAFALGGVIVYALGKIK